MLNRGDALDKTLEDLAALGTDRDREQLAAVRDRLAAARLRVLVAGEAKRGKSTLINALLGRPVLPSGVTPLTAVATTVRYGEDPHAEVRFGDGHEEKHPLAALDDLVTERGNPRNRRGIPPDMAHHSCPICGRPRWSAWLHSRSPAVRGSAGLTREGLHAAFSPARRRQEGSPPRGGAAGCPARRMNPRTVIAGSR